MMPYLGGHILLSIPLRFPFGSIIRPMLVAGALGWCTVLLMRRKIDRAEWKREFGIHSPLVMFVAAIPGAGSVAYLASEPIRRNRLMMRVMTDAMLFKLPKKVYLKSGTRKWIARPARNRAGDAGFGSTRQLTRSRWPHRDLPPGCDSNLFLTWHRDPTEWVPSNHSPSDLDVVVYDPLPYCRHPDRSRAQRGTSRSRTVRTDSDASGDKRSFDKLRMTNGAIGLGSA